MENSQQLCTLRGHLNVITCMIPIKRDDQSEITLLTGDEKGWVIWWDITIKRPIGTWKAHSSRIVTMKRLINGLLLTHSRDSTIKIWNLSSSNKLSVRIPDPQFDEVDVNVENLHELEGKQLSLVTNYPPPDFVSIAVNALNFCNVDCFNHLLVTPSTMNSESFDIYSIFEGDNDSLPLYERLHLRRLVTNFDGWSLYEKTLKMKEDIDDEIVSENSSTKRDKFGIVMSLLFVDENILFVGYESGHIVAFAIGHQSFTSIDRSRYLSGRCNFSDEMKTAKHFDKTVINKESSLKVLYSSSMHVPNPVITMSIHNNNVISGSTNNVLLVHDFLNKRQRKLVFSNSGIQSLNTIDNKLIIGYWAGLIRGYAFDSQEKLFKIRRSTPVVESLQSNVDDRDNETQKNDKIKLTSVAVSSREVQNSATTYKLMVRRKNKFTSKNLLYSGYEDGTISVHAV